jgi:hypothetical protein
MLSGIPRRRSSYEAEFEADAAGAVLATETAVRLGYSNALTSVTPNIFLKGIEVVDACQSLHERATEGIDSTHPSSKDRLHSIRAVMERHRSRKNPDGNHPIVLQRIDQLFYYIRQQAVTGIVKRSAIGMTSRERENLRLFEGDNPPNILGLWVDPAGSRRSEMACPTGSAARTIEVTTRHRCQRGSPSRSSASSPERVYSGYRR